MIRAVSKLANNCSLMCVIRQDDAYRMLSDTACTARWRHITLQRLHSKHMEQKFALFCRISLITLLFLFSYFFTHYLTFGCCNFHLWTYLILSIVIPHRSLMHNHLLHY